MLNHLRQRVEDVLSTARTVTLSTYGSAGIQASIFPGEAVGLNLYLLIPRTSNHLFNLEQNQGVVITSAGWQMRGMAYLVEDCPEALALARHPDAAWCQIVQVRPTRFQIEPSGPAEHAETIDID